MTRYLSCSINQHVDSPRDFVWNTIVKRLRCELHDAVALSVEEPWRMCLDLAHTEPDLKFFQVTFLLREDQGGCFVSAGLVVNADACEQGLRARDAMAQRLDVVLRET